MAIYLNCTMMDRLTNLKFLNLLDHILYRHQYDISSTLHKTCKQTVPNVYELSAKWYVW